MAQPRIYVADLAAYNDGKLVGEWLDLSDYNDGDEVMHAIKDLLAQWSKESGEEREEFAIHDYEGFPEEYYSEYMGKEDFDKIIKIIKAAEENDLPVEVLLEYASNVGADPEDLKDLPYYGKFDDEEDFAYRVVESGEFTDLEIYLDMYPTDMRIFSQQEADERVENMDEDDLLEAADMKDEVEEFEEKESRIESIKDEIEEVESEIDELYEIVQETEADAERIDNKVEELRERIEDLKNEKEELYYDLKDFDFRDRDEAVDKAKEKLREEYYDEIYEALEKDAVGYFVDTFGYEVKDLVDSNGFFVDYAMLARDLSDSYLFIEHDGDLYVFNNYARGGKLYKKGGIVGDVHDLEDDMLRTKIEIFLDKVKGEAFKFYYIDADSQCLYVGFDESFTQKDADKVYAAATSSVEFFDADGVDMTYNGETGDSVFKIPLKREVSFEHGGVMAKGGEVGDKVKLVEGYGYWDLSKYRYGNDFKRFKAGVEGQFIKGTRKLGNEIRLKLDDGREVITQIQAIDLPTYEEKQMLYEKNKHLFSFGFKDGGIMKKGGKVTFKRKVKSISESLLERKKVPTRLQKDYGKTYDKKESVEAAKRIAGAMRKKEMAKKKK